MNEGLRISKYQMQKASHYGFIAAGLFVSNRRNRKPETAILLIKHYMAFMGGSTPHCSFPGVQPVILRASGSALLASCPFRRPEGDVKCKSVDLRDPGSVLREIGSRIGKAICSGKPQIDGIDEEVLAPFADAASHELSALVTRHLLLIEI